MKREKKLGEGIKSARIKGNVLGGKERPHCEEKSNQKKGTNMIFFSRKVLSHRAEKPGGV